MHPSRQLLPCPPPGEPEGRSLQALFLAGVLLLTLAVPTLAQGDSPSIPLPGPREEVPSTQDGVDVGVATVEGMTARSAQDEDAEDTEVEKEDKKCDTVAAPVGDPLCADGGTKCKTDGAACVKNGRCGKCSNVVTADANGHRCRGCVCNTLFGSPAFSEQP